MGLSRDRLERVLDLKDEQAVADGFAEVIEDRLVFDSSAEDYLASFSRLPSPEQLSQRVSGFAAPTGVFG